VGQAKEVAELVHEHQCQELPSQHNVRTTTSVQLGCDSNGLATVWQRRNPEEVVLFEAVRDDHIDLALLFPFPRNALIASQREPAFVGSERRSGHRELQQRLLLAEPSIDVGNDPINVPANLVLRCPVAGQVASVVLHNRDVQVR